MLETSDNRRLVLCWLITGFLLPLLLHVSLLIASGSIGEVLEPVGLTTPAFSTSS